MTLKAFTFKCPRLDSNQHTRRRCDLNTVRLPFRHLGIQDDKDILFPEIPKQSKHYFVKIVVRDFGIRQNIRKPGIRK